MTKRIPLWCFLAVLAGSRVSSADEMTKEAEARFQEGLEFARGGKYEDARAKFLQSLAVSKSAKTLLNLAIAEKNSGHPSDALRHLRAYFRDPNASSSKVSELKKELVPSLYETTAHVRIEAPIGAAVTCDGEPVERLEEEYDIAPGAHAIAALFDGRREDRSVSVAKGELRVVSFAASVAREAAPPILQPAPRVDEAKRSYWTSRRIAGLALVGVGVAGGLSAFGIFRSAASSDDSDASWVRDGLQSQGKTCATSSSECDRLSSLVDDRVRHNGWAIGSLIIGGAIAGTGAVLFLLPEKRDAGAHGESLRVRAGFATIDVMQTF